MNIGIYIWPVVFAISIIVEACTLSLVAIWFIPSSIVSLILSFFNVQIYWQIVVFFIIAGLLLFATRPLCKKTFHKMQNQPTNVESLIGKEAIVIETINNLNETGTIKINGLTWTARTKSNDEIIEKGIAIIIDEIIGVKIICHKK